MPFLSLKKITAGSYSPVAVAARATVNPFFSAFVVFIRMTFFPLKWLVLLLGISKRTIVWSMLTMPDGSILWAFQTLIMLWRKSCSCSAKSAGSFCEALVPDRMPTPKHRFQHRSHIGKALKLAGIPMPPAISLARPSSILFVTTRPSDLSSSRKSNSALSSSKDTGGLPG